MSDNAATGDLIEASTLEAQIANADSQDRSAAIDSKEQTQKEEKPASENKEGSQEPEESTDDSADQQEEKPAPVEEDQKPEEGQEDDKDKKSEEYKLGNRVFGTVEDALAEANRVVGHNANLAGKLTEAESQLAEALRVNQEWVEWHKSLNETDEEGEQSPAKRSPVDIDPDDLAKKAADEAVKRIQHDTRVAQLREQFSQELQTIKATNHYFQIQDIIEQLADKVNPLTGNYFTPLEAYKFACTERGVTPELGSNGKPVEDKKAPRKIANPDAARSATRPSGGAPGASKEAPERSYVDDELSTHFPTM